MRYRFLHPIKIVIQHPRQMKSYDHIGTNSNKHQVINNATRYKLMSFSLSCLLAISETLPLMPNIKSNGLIHIIQDVIKEHSLS